MKPIVQLRSIITNVSTVEKEIANYIISNPDRVTKMSIHELAKESYSSTSSIVRLCKNLGYSGFKEFKHALLAELMAFGDTESHLETPIMATDSISEIIEKTTQNNIQSLNDTRHLIDNNALETIVDRIHDSQIYPDLPDRPFTGKCCSGDGCHVLQCISGKDSIAILPAREQIIQALPRLRRNPPYADCLDQHGEGKRPRLIGRFGSRLLSNASQKTGPPVRETLLRREVFTAKTRNTA